MAKHRPQFKPKAPTVSAAETGKRGGAGARSAVPSPQTAAAPPISTPPRRSTYFEAVGVYERGLEALQRHDYQSAVTLLESVLQTYPEEKELHERVRLYLNICQRQVVPRETAPQTLDERLYAATLAINGARYDEALSLLRLVRDEDPDNDHALYMLAVAHAQRDEFAEALVHLQRAVALNPENRALARRDPDFEPLRDNEAFRSALETAALPMRPIDRKRPLRPKTGRG
jgi:tetratricopeptide (TPR) repeat protein